MVHAGARGVGSAAWLREGIVLWQEVVGDRTAGDRTVGRQ